MVQLFDLPNLDSPAASTPRILIAWAGSNDGWRGADCWFVASPGSEPIPVGPLRPAAALGALAEPLAAGTSCLFDLSGMVVVDLFNPSMTLESVDSAALLGGANRAMVGGELLQFGEAAIIEPGRWRLSRLLRGRAGTAGGMSHPAGEPFVLLDDPALLMLPDELAAMTGAGTATLQWAPRNGTALTEIGIAAAGQALRPLSPAHARIRPHGAGGVAIEWARRSRVDAGWRDHVDQPLGENREMWRVSPLPPVPGVGPWELTSPALTIGAGDLAALAPGHMIEIRQIGDFSQSPPLALALT
jgi:hypothetical protein